MNYSARRRAASSCNASQLPSFLVCFFVGITTLASEVVTTDVTTTEAIPDPGTVSVVATVNCVVPHPLLYTV